MSHQGSPVTLHWAPDCYISPCFNHYNPDGAVVRCLTRTQVALHEKDLLCAELLRQAAADKEEWERQQRLMMEQLRAMQVRNAEAERLFKCQEQKLDNRLKGTTSALDELSQQHQQLQCASAEQLRYLQHQLAQLQATLADMQAERAQLQAQLQDAHATKAALQKAADRIAQLEAGIAAAQARAQHMLDKVQKERDAVQAANRQLQGELADTQRALADQLEKKQAAQQQSKLLVLQTQQLNHALNLERLINEPLRHTNHMSTTVAHVMRSAANTMVEHRAHVPVSSAHVGTTTYVLAGVQEPQQQPTSPQAHSQHHQLQLNHEQQLEEIPHAFVPLVPQDARSSTLTQQAHSMPAASPSGTTISRIPGSASPAQLHPSSAVEPLSPPRQYDIPVADQHLQSAAAVVNGPVAVNTANVLQPSLAPDNRRSPRQGQSPTSIRTVGGDALTRLGRAWATTTPTAGHPVAAFQDNIQRFAGIYHEAAVAATPKDIARPRSAGPMRRAVPLQPPLSAAKLESCLQAAAGAVRPSTAGRNRTARKPSVTLVSTYNDMREATGKSGGGSSPASRVARKGARARSLHSTGAGSHSTAIPAVYSISTSSSSSSSFSGVSFSYR